MIICPTCKEEIDSDSQFCDQCGQELLFCNQCGRVGIGRRCTHCGGLMMSPNQQQAGQKVSGRLSESLANSSFGIVTNTSVARPLVQQRPTGVAAGVPVLTLVNDSLNIRIVGINGAVIGRRQGPYQQLFEGNMFISGVHAQLVYKPDTGWCIIDKHSSNGTKLNQRDLLPDIPMSIKTGDIITLANISLQVSVR